MAFLELAGLTKRYATQAVVEDVTLAVDRGKLVCLLGPSGCGKTTTLRLIAGFVPASAGEIRVGGTAVLVGGLDRPAGSPEHVDDLPELRALAAHDRVPERRLRAEAAQAAAAAEIRPASTTSWRPRTSRRSWIAIPASSRAASSSACRSPVHWW